MLKDNPSLAYLAVFLGVTGHASSEFFAVLSGVSGPEASVWRYLLGGFGLVIMALVMPGREKLFAPMVEEGPKLVLLALFGVSLPYLMFHWALDYATVVQVGTIVTTMPIFVGIINRVLNKMPIGVPKMITGGAAILGVALLITDGYMARLAGTEGQLIGIGMTLICAAAGSAYAVVAKPYIIKHGAIRITALTMMMGGIALWLIVGTAWNIWVNPATLFDRGETQAASLLTLAIWNTTFTQLLWIGGLAAVPDITRGSYLFFLKPVLTALLAFLFLSQAITTVQIVAILVICGSVLVELFWPYLAGKRQAG